ncbi:hypothetical protein [Halorussus lipolyticus]|uniref:hypothetical protein n=1 Tax=Halorussus lipolyticus TaxID=3034024 RepID=UPI0023E8720D|nr:hypothetical protein [Halorussus sp. DT80]
MPSERPDDQGGIERRDLIKGLGLGALAVTGTSAMAETVAAQDGMISFAALTPPGEDVEDDTIREFTDGFGGEYTGDLVFSLKLGIERSVPLGYQITIVDRDDNTVVPGTFEEGSSRAFGGTIKSDSAGYALERERISVEGLGPENPLESPNHYWAVLTVVDYSGLSLKDSESNCAMDCANVPFSVKHWMQNQ